MGKKLNGEDSYSPMEERADYHIYLLTSNLPATSRPIALANSTGSCLQRNPVDPSSTVYRKEWDGNLFENGIEDEELRGDEVATGRGRVSSTVSSGRFWL